MSLYASYTTFIFGSHVAQNIFYDILIQFFYDTLKLFYVAFHFFLDIFISLYNIIYVNNLWTTFYWIFVFVFVFFIGHFLRYLFFKSPPK